MQTMTASDAKNNFGNLLEAAAKDRVQIQRNGKVVAVVVNPSDLAAFDEMYAFARAVRRLAARDAEIVEALADFSAGQIGRHVAVRKTGLVHFTQLLDLIGMTNLPLPTLPEETLDRMVRDAVEATSGALR